MKRRVCLILVAFVLLLTACSALAQSEPQVEAMLSALAQRDNEAAYALADPEAFADFEAFSAQIAPLFNLLDGRIWEKYSYTNVSVNINNGVRTETASMLVKFTDGTSLKLDYITRNEKFVSFYLTKPNGGKTS